MRVDARKTLKNRAAAIVGMRAPGRRNAPAADRSARRALWCVAAGRRIAPGACRARGRRCKRHEQDCPRGNQRPDGIETAFAHQSRGRRITIVTTEIDHIGLAGGMVMRCGCGIQLCGGGVNTVIEVGQYIVVMQGAMAIGNDNRRATHVVSMEVRRPPHTIDQRGARLHRQQHDQQPNGAWPEQSPHAAQAIRIIDTGNEASCHAGSSWGWLANQENP